MKRLLIILSTLLLIGCSKVDSLKRVQTQYPNCEVRQLPIDGWHYIVRDEGGSVWYVKDSPFWSGMTNTNATPYKLNGVELIK